MIGINIEMPRGCMSCPFSYIDDDENMLICSYKASLYDTMLYVDGFESERPEWCPLCELPSNVLNEEECNRLLDFLNEESNDPTECKMDIDK